MWNDSQRSRAGYLKGEIALAAEDARRSAELDAKIARQREAQPMTRRERNALWMAENRKPLTKEQRAAATIRLRQARARAKLAAKGINL